MAGGGVALQLLATQHCSEAGRALQLVAMARPAKRCSLLLWRGRQSVATCYCGEARNGLQLTAMAMASSAATRDAGPTARCSPGQRCATAFLFFVFFYSTTSRAKERKTEREREGEPLKPVQRSPLCWLAGM